MTTEIEHQGVRNFSQNHMAEKAEPEFKAVVPLTMDEHAFLNALCGFKEHLTRVEEVGFGTVEWSGLGRVRSRNRFILLPYRSPIHTLDLHSHP